MKCLFAWTEKESYNDRKYGFEKPYLGGTMEGKKYESDLTRKEKREIEKQKLKSMNGKEKLEYIRSYYMFHILGVIAVIGLIIFAFNTYERSKIKTELAVTIVDAVENIEGRTVLEEKLAEVYCKGDKYKQVNLDTAVSSADSYTFSVKMDTQLAAKMIDVIICDEKTYNGLTKQQVFMSFEELLGEDYSTYESYIKDGKIDVSQSNILKQSGLILYEPAYLGIVVNTEQKENAKQLLDILFE